MGGIAMGNFQRAMECFNEWDAKKSEELARNEDAARAQGSTGFPAPVPPWARISPRPDSSAAPIP